MIVQRLYYTVPIPNSLGLAQSLAFLFFLKIFQKDDNLEYYSHIFPLKKCSFFLWCELFAFGEKV